MGDDPVASRPIRPSDDLYREMHRRGDWSASRRRALAEALWEDHGRYVFAYACRRLGNAEDAAEVCQETFFRVIRSLEREPRREPDRVHFRGLLSVIARHLVVDQSRGRTRLRPVDTREFEPILADATSPDEGLLREERLAALRECLESLSDRRREIVVLSDLEGRAGADVADRMNLRIGNVYTTLHRARRELRDCVAGKVGSGGGG